MGSKLLRTATLAVVLTVASLVLVATPASADSAPSWVRTVVHRHAWANHVHVTNNCRTQQRGKVVVRFHPDSACHVLAPGEKYTFTHHWGLFDRLESC